ncbi:MAG: hypothetical protein V1493_02485 [Candidatus Diapherotrites archaeon]
MLKKPAGRAAKDVGGTRIVIHLGNVDGGKGRRPASKSKNYAKRFPNVRFKGFDVKGLVGRRPRNLEQKKTDFLSGLEGEADNSVEMVTSEMALGHYARKPRNIDDTLNPERRPYTRSVIALAYRKLMPGGRMHIAIGYVDFQPVVRMLKRAGFEVESHELKDSRRTPWTNFYGITHQITATKPKGKP